MLIIGIFVGVIAYGVYLWRAARSASTRPPRRAHQLSAPPSSTARSSARPTGPGPHFKRPWQRVHHVAMMEQSLELSGEEGGRTAMAYDGTILRFDSILRFQPIPAGARALPVRAQEPARAHHGPVHEPPAERDRQLPAVLVPGLTAPGRCAWRPGPGVARGHRRRVRPDPPRARAPEPAHRGVLPHADRPAVRRAVQRRGPDRTSRLPTSLADALNAVINTQTEAESLYSHAEADTRQQVVAAEHGVEIAKARGLATELEINTLGDVLAKLHADGTLADYVGRRRAEVISQSKTLYMRSGS